MQIPFFNKKKRKLLKQNEDRLYLMSKEEQEKIFSNEEINLETKIFELLYELNEIKFLYDELDLEFAKGLKSGGTYVFSMGTASFDIIPNVKVQTDNKIKLSRSRKIEIRAKEKVGRIIGRFGRVLQFRAFFVEYEGEYTYDPIDETPIELKIKNEKQLELAHTTAEAEIGTSLMKDIGREKKKWQEYIPTILLTIFGIAFLFYLGQYNLIKPV